MFLLHFRDPNKSVHWLAGYDKGYEMRKIKNEETDKYLISHGFDPQSRVEAI